MEIHKLKRKKLSPAKTLKEILHLFSIHNINLSRFHVSELNNRKKEVILAVDWCDSKEEQGITVLANSGCVVYTLPSWKQAEKIRDAVFNAEPKIGEKVKIKLDSDVITFGNHPGISLKGVEATVYQGDIAIPTTTGVKLMLRRAKRTLGFDQGWISFMETDAVRPENKRRLRLIARNSTCTVISKPKMSLDLLSALIAGGLPMHQADIIKVNRIKKILQENISKLPKSRKSPKT